VPNFQPPRADGGPTLARGRRPKMPSRVGCPVSPGATTSPWGYAALTEFENRCNSPGGGILVTSRAAFFAGRRTAGPARLRRTGKGGRAEGCDVPRQFRSQSVLGDALVRKPLAPRMHVARSTRWSPTCDGLGRLLHLNPLQPPALRQSEVTRLRILTSCCRKQQSWTSTKIRATITTSSASDGT